MVESEKEKMDKLEDMQKKLQGFMDMQKMEQSKCFCWIINWCCRFTVLVAST